MGPPDDETIRRVARELRERHRRFVEERLTGPGARARWGESVASAMDQLLATRVADLLDVAHAERVLDEALSREAIEHGARPLSKASTLMEVSQLREERERAGAFVPDSARRSLEALLAKKQLVPPALLREVLTHEAVEATMRDMLHGALREFSDAVNPFFSDWGVLGILKKLSPFGLGPMQKSFEQAQREFEKRLDPEIKRFLQGFSRQAVRKLADYAIDRADDPPLVAMRKELLAWTLDRPVQELFVVLDDEALALWENAVFEVIAHVAGSERSRAQRRATLEMIKGAHGAQTLDEALRVYGVTYRPSAEVLADAAWPLVQAALAHPEVMRFFTALVDDFYDEVDDAPTGAPIT